MTVKELIHELKKVNQNLEVIGYGESVDYTGDVTKVVVDTWYTRSNNPIEYCEIHFE